MRPVRPRLTPFLLTLLSACAGSSTAGLRTAYPDLELPPVACAAASTVFAGPEIVVRGEEIVAGGNSLVRLSRGHVPAAALDPTGAVDTLRRWATDSLGGADTGQETRHPVVWIDRRLPAATLVAVLRTLAIAGVRRVAWGGDRGERSSDVTWVESPVASATLRRGSADAPRDVVLNAVVGADKVELSLTRLAFDSSGAIQGLTAPEIVHQESLMHREGAPDLEALARRSLALSAQHGAGGTRIIAVTPTLSVGALAHVVGAVCPEATPRRLLISLIVEDAAAAVAREALRRRHASQRAVNLTAGAIRVNGPLKQADAVSAVATGIVDIKTCYDAALGTDAGPTGQVDIAISLAEDGRVTAVELLVDELQMETLPACLDARIRRWPFPAADAPSRVETSFDIRATRGRH